MANKKRIIGPILLISAAMIWGLSFVAQKQGMEYVDGFTFNGIRSLLGGIVLLPIIIFRSIKNKDSVKLSPAEKKSNRKDVIKGIIIVGTMLCIGSNLQQFAFDYIEPGKVGFITALYMLLVPLISFIIYKKNASRCSDSLRRYNELQLCFYLPNHRSEIYRTDACEYASLHRIRFLGHILFHHSRRAYDGC